MTEKEFENCKIGDTVICNTSFEMYPQKGWKGRIIFKKEEDLKIGIEWKKPFMLGHNCNGLGQNDFCFYYSFRWPKQTENTSIIDLYKPEQLEFEF